MSLLLRLGLHRITGLTSIIEHLLSLGFSAFKLFAIFCQQTFAFLASLFRLLQGILDGVFALLQHAVEQRPAELGEDDPQDDEGDEHRDEFIHVWKNRTDSLSFFSSECRQGAKCSHTKQCDNADRQVVYIFAYSCFQFACLLLVYRKLRNR